MVLPSSWLERGECSALRRETNTSAADPAHTALLDAHSALGSVFSIGFLVALITGGWSALQFPCSESCACFQDCYCSEGSYLGEVGCVPCADGFTSPVFSTMPSDCYPCEAGYYCKNVRELAGSFENKKIRCSYDETDNILGASPAGETYEHKGDEVWCPGGNALPTPVPMGMCGKGSMWMRTELVLCGNMTIPSPLIVAQTQYPGSTEATVLVRNDGGAPISVSLKTKSDSPWISSDTREYEINEGRSAYIKVKLERCVGVELACLRAWVRAWSVKRAFAWGLSLIVDAYCPSSSFSLSPTISHPVPLLLYAHRIRLQRKSEDRH